MLSHYATAPYAHNDGHFRFRYQIQKKETAIKILLFVSHLMSGIISARKNSFECLSYAIKAEVYLSILHKNELKDFG